jgi:tetratricopeptide (TPR) repeat protein
VTARTASRTSPAASTDPGESSAWSGGARLILALLFLLLPVAHSATLSDPFELPKEGLLAGAAVLLLVCLAAASARRNPKAATFRARLPIAVPLAIALVAAGLATARAAAQGIALSGFLMLASLLVVAAAVPLAVRRDRDALLLLGAAMAGMTLAAVASLAQILRPGFNLMLGPFSIIPPAPAGGTFGDPGLLAQALLLALPLAIGAAVLCGGALRLVVGAVIGILCAALLYGGKPEGWLVGGGVVALLLVVRVARSALSGNPWADLVPDPGGPTVRTILAAGAGLALVLAAARLPGMGTGGAAPAPLEHVGLLAPTTGDVTADRAAGMRGSLALLGRHPLGVGPGTWRHAFLEVAWTAVPSSPFSLSHQAVHAGQSFLEAGAELGIVASLALAVLLAVTLWRAFRAALRDGGAWGSIGLTSCIAILTGALVACYGSPFQEAAPAALFAFACGLGLAAWQRVTAGEDAEEAGASGFVSGRRRALRLAAGLVGVVALAAAGLLILPPRVAAARLTLQAQGLLGAGDARGALQLLTSPVARRAADHLPHALRGQAALRVGAWQDASDAFAETLKRSPYFVSAHLGRAAAEEMLGHFDRSAAEIDAASALWPDSYDILMARGRLDVRRGRIEQAMADYQEAAKAGPKMGDPWFALGEILLRRGDNDRAIEAFHLCLEKNPRFPHINLNLAIAYEKRGMNDMALSHLQREAALDDRAIEPRLRMANLFHAEGRDCDAKDALGVARDLETDPSRRATLLGLIDQMDASCRLEQKRRR